MTTEQIRAWVDEYSDMNVQDDESNGLLIMDGYDDCIVGIAEQFNRVFVVYDRTKVINKLVEQGMTLEEAEEFHEFNQAGAWMGEGTPAFLIRPDST
jgi:light-regulated signal transduction histidine kinase (bacteriophytochrome)